MKREKRGERGTLAERWNEKDRKNRTWRTCTSSLISRSSPRCDVTDPQPVIRIGIENCRWIPPPLPLSFLSHFLSFLLSLSRFLENDIAYLTGLLAISFTHRVSKPLRNVAIGIEISSVRRFRFVFDRSFLVFLIILYPSFYSLSVSLSLSPLPLSRRHCGGRFFPLINLNKKGKRVGQRRDDPLCSSIERTDVKR